MYLESVNVQTEGKDLRIVTQDLKVRFFTSKGVVKAIDNLSFSVRPGEVYGLVGESGSGKSVTATSVLDLIPDPPGRIVRGQIYIEGFNVLANLNREARLRIKKGTVIVKRNKRAIKRHNNVMAGIRGKRVSMVFQEPFLSLNPVMTVGDQIVEAILQHNRVGIANSIINRETMGASGIEKFVDAVMSQPDTRTRNEIITKWCDANSLPDIEGDLRDLFENSTDRDFILRETKVLVEQAKTGIDLTPINEAKQYYTLKDLETDLQIELIEYTSKEDDAKIQETEEKLKEVKSVIRKDFLFFPLIQKFSRKKFVKPFRDSAERKTLELLRRVNIAGAERVMDSYPHELSGGMLQRAVIAMALSSEPRVLIADEPTTSLDVTTQAQILEIMKGLNEDFNTSIIFITHDLAVIAEMCNRVAVMYGGNIVEEGSVMDIFKDAKHPYTTGLMNAIPRAEMRFDKSQRLESIPGSVPDLIKPPSGCRFHPRCKFRMDICSEKKPRMVEIESGHSVACFLYSDEVEEEKIEVIP